jgi:hypothetical protein
MMNSSWKAVAYIMGANAQVFFLFLGAFEVSKGCLGSSEGLCAFEAFFLPFALVVSGFVYYKVLWHLAKTEKGRK